MLDDLIRARKSVEDRLPAVEDAEAARWHRVNAMYVDRILDVLKAQERERELDHDQLLVEALYAVVRFLIEQGQTECAQVLGDHLEEIGYMVKEHWRGSSAFSVWLPGMKTSAPASPGKSLPSGAAPPRKKKKDAAGP
ncbi:MAG: hypothetical protein ACE5ER_09085 [Nitrospinaceae bacterium]